MASIEDAEARVRQLEERLKEQEELLKKEKELRMQEKELWMQEKELRVQAEMKIAKTSFADFLSICHTDIFMKLDVQRNELLATTGGFTRVDGKNYPCYLQPWTDFDDLHEAAFVRLEHEFQQQQLFPSPAGLEYLAEKLSDTKLASEEDLKSFEFLAVEGCVLDALSPYVARLSRGSPDWPRSLKAITFNNYPFGVVAADLDEEGTSEPESERGRSRSSRSSRSRQGRGSANKPLRIRDDRPAYIGALGVAKRDMDAARERAEAAAEERERMGPPKKRQSPERTKVHPDQWCFRTDTDGSLVPLFVVEYKAAHKIDNEALRQSLMPDEATSLMEDAIRSIASEYIPDEPLMTKISVARVLTQAFHYMVDYGLQYSYVTTGEALIFLFLDPAKPSTAYYYLAEPKTAVRSTERDHIKHSAVALVLAFVLISIQGQYMSQRWKKMAQKTLRKWPYPYKEEEDTPAESVHDPLEASRNTLNPKDKSAGSEEACEDPAKHSRARRRDRDDENDGGDPSFRPAKAHKDPAAGSRPLTTRSTRSSSSKRAPATTGSQRKPEPVWTFRADTVLTPTLDYCTQACLLGLKTGGTLDLDCPNVGLHCRGRGRGSPAATPQSRHRHPLSARDLCEQLVQQLAEDMDHDCHSLERHGLFGATGALFKLALSRYGYCLVGKGVQRAHCGRLELEAAAYSLLEPCQGRLVPVNLGTIGLVDEYWTMCGAHVSHMMLMAFGGEPLWRHGQRPGSQPERLAREVRRTLDEIRPFGVVHGDENSSNMVWSVELQRVMLIDFDHSAIQPKGEIGEGGKAGQIGETKKTGGAGEAVKIGETGDTEKTGQTRQTRQARRRTAEDSLLQHPKRAKLLSSPPQPV